MLEEECLDGSHIVISVKLNDFTSVIPTHALVDCGATGYAFVDEEFARNHNLPMFKLNNPRLLEVIDGRPIESGTITHYVKTQMSINGHKEQVAMFITKLGHYPIVLGIPWLRRHDVSISFARNTVTFDSDFCLRQCCENAVTIKGISIPIPEKPSIAMIAGSTFSRTVYRSKGALTAHSTTIHEIDRALRGPIQEEWTIEDDKIKALVPSDYHDYLPLFKKAATDILPPHRSYDHKIPLKEGFTPPYGPLYSLSKLELQALREWLDENTSKGFIRASSSPAGAPILFVKKKDGSLRLCVDYRGLNEGTIKNRYPLPLIRETLLQLSKARYYTTLDIRSAYNLIRMAEGEEWKTAFRT